jgi:hypothetical protein
LDIITKKKVYNKLLENILENEKQNNQECPEYFENRAAAKLIFTDIVKTISPFEINNFEEAVDYMSKEKDYSFHYGFDVGEGKYPLQLLNEENLKCN